MTPTLTCRHCATDLVAGSEDELVDLAQQHAREHGHSEPPDRERLLARIRRHDPAPASPPAGSPEEP